MPAAELVEYVARSLVDDPEAVIDRLMAERHPVYADADIHIQSRDVAHDVVIDDILTALADHLGREVAEHAPAK